MWNYRLVQEADHGGDPYFEMREVYYDVEGKPCAHSPATILSETLQGTHDVFEMMQVAFNKPVLRFPDDFTGDMHKEIDE